MVSEPRRNAHLIYVHLQLLPFIAHIQTKILDYFLHVASLTCTSIEKLCRLLLPREKAAMIIRNITVRLLPVRRSPFTPYPDLRRLAVQRLSLRHS